MRIGLASMALGATALAFALVLALWHGISGLGAVRLRNWARYSLIILTVLELPGGLLAVVAGLLAVPGGQLAMLGGVPLVLLSVMIVSVLILIYLLRQPVARIFGLGLGPATLPIAEADALERVIRGEAPVRRTPRAAR